MSPRYREAVALQSQQVLESRAQRTLPPGERKKARGKGNSSRSADLG